VHRRAEHFRLGRDAAAVQQARDGQDEHQARLAGRADPYGGTLTVGPRSSGGTELCWQVPLPSAASATAGLA
jgi:hypothetical protein